MSADLDAHSSAQGRGAILMYHRIASTDSDPFGLAVPHDLFREQMDFLAHRYRPMQLEDLAESSATGRIPERAVAITFDDGYLDACEAASSILPGIGLPATFFLNTDRVDELHEAWWDRLEAIFCGGALLPGAFEFSWHGSSRRFDTGTPAERLHALLDLAAIARAMTLDERADLVLRLRRWSGLDEAVRSTHRILLRREMVELASVPGLAIGAHSTHHLALSTQNSDVLRDEIVLHKLELEQLLGRPVRSFSYPYGDYSPETVALVREASFALAVTAEKGAVVSGGDRYRLPRLEVRSWDLETFESRLGELVG